MQTDTPHSHSDRVAHGRAVRARKTAQKRADIEALHRVPTWTEHPEAKAILERLAADMPRSNEILLGHDKMLHETRHEGEAARDLRRLHKRFGRAVDGEPARRIFMDIVENQPAEVIERLRDELATGEAA